MRIFRYADCLGCKGQQIIPTHKDDAWAAEIPPSRWSSWPRTTPGTCRGSLPPFAPTAWAWKRWRSCSSTTQARTIRSSLPHLGRRPGLRRHPDRRPRAPHGAGRGAGSRAGHGKRDVLLCLEGDCLLTGRYLRECLDELNRKGRDIVLTGFATLGGAEATAAAPVEQGCPDGPHGHVVLMRRCAWSP
jgi:hypothetical protein